MRSDWKNVIGFLVEEFSRMIRAFGLPGILSTGDRHRQCDHAKLDNVAGMYKVGEVVHYKYKITCRIAFYFRTNIKDSQSALTRLPVGIR